MSKPSWYETGYEGAQREQDKRQLGYPPDRLWQKPGATREVVFADDSPFCVREFSWRGTDGQWHHETDPGIGAVGAMKSQYVGHYTIIDTNGYKDKEGVEHKYRLMLLPGKTRVLSKLKFKKENRQDGSLLNALWQLARADDNAPSTGDDLEFIRAIDVEKLYPMVTYKSKNVKEMIDRVNAGGAEAPKMRKYLAHHFKIPAEGPIPPKLPVFNYEALFAPREPDMLREMMKDAAPFGSKFTPGKPQTATSDDIPF